MTAGREIALDTETTGISHRQGHRLIEVGCVELMHKIPTGEYFHRYIDPGRDVDPEAVAVHGLTREFLSEFETFSDIAADLDEFIGDSPLVIHNAAFDIGFIDAEFQRIGYPAIGRDRAICTLEQARKKWPGAKATLDAVCERLGIKNENRQLHGALKDARILADAYLEMSGGRQIGLELAAGPAIFALPDTLYAYRRPRQHAATPEELAAHEALMASLKDPLWLDMNGAVA